MGLLFGFAGAHTYPKSGQVPPPAFDPDRVTEVFNLGCTCYVLEVDFFVRMV